MLADYLSGNVILRKYAPRLHYLEMVCRLGALALPSYLPKGTVGSNPQHGSRTHDPILILQSHTGVLSLSIINSRRDSKTKHPTT